jgi:hypothetical protein
MHWTVRLKRFGGMQRLQTVRNWQLRKLARMKPKHAGQARLRRECLDFLQANHVRVLGIETERMLEPQ